MGGPIYTIAREKHTEIKDKGEVATATKLAKRTIENVTRRNILVNSNTGDVNELGNALLQVQDVSFRSGRRRRDRMIEP